MTAPGPICVLGLALLAPTLTAQATEHTLKAKLVGLRDRVAYQRAVDTARSAFGDSIKVGGVRIAVEKHARHVLVARGPRQKPSQKVRSGKSFRFSTDHTGGKKLPPIAFHREPDGAWFVQPPRAALFRFGKLDVRIVDSDLDGKFEVGDDSFLVNDLRIARRLKKRFSIGVVGIEILELAPNGLKLRMKTTLLAGTKEQLAALAALNGYRARHGLEPVALDPKLSKGCTEHALYLQGNGWSGRTNPHSQEAGTAGATEAGAQAAVRSVISSGSVDRCVHGLWRTFYHRIGLMSPGLTKVGINDVPTSLSVIDVAQYREARDSEEWPFAEPTFVPADGSRHVLKHASGERPEEPVPQLGRRGMPLMAVFRESDGVTMFDGKLFKLRGRRVAKVPVLSAKRGRYPRVFGIVPAAPLDPKSSYRAEFTWRENGEPRRKVIRFQTR